MTEKVTPLDLIIKAERASASATALLKSTLSAFSEHFVKTGVVSRDLGVLLKHAETFRYVADYEGCSVAPRDAQDIVQQSQLFVSALRSLLIAQ